MTTHEYSYCFLRYRQDPEAGEFANVGVAIWCPSARFVGFQGSPQYSRLTHFFGNLDRRGYRSLIAHVERSFDALSEEISSTLALSGYPENVRELALRVVPQDDGALIWSPPRGGLSRDPNAELSRLYARFIGRRSEGEEKPRRDEGQVFREVYRKAFTSEKVMPKLREREVVAPLAHYTFKYAWQNGVWNVYEPLSFDLENPDSIERKAHAWFGRSIHLMESPDRPKLHFLLGKPSISENCKAYTEAKAILASANVTVIEEDDVDQFARELELAVGKA